MRSTMKTLIIIAVLVGMAAPAMAVSAPLVEYMFNESGGEVAWSTFSPSPDAEGSRLTMYAGHNETNNWVTMDRHTDDGLGMSGLAGDRALNLKDATQMGLAKGGNGGRARSAGSPPLPLTTLASFTVTMWFNNDNNGNTFEGGPTELGFDTRLLGLSGWNAGAGEPGFDIQVGGVGLGWVMLKSDGESVNAGNMGFNLANKWYFLAISYDGTKTTDNVQFYKGSDTDAVTAVGGPKTLNKGVMNVGANALVLGNERDHWAFAYDGYMDDVRIWGDAADSSGVIGLQDIQAVYAADLANTSVPEPATMLLLGLGGLLIRRKR